MTRLMQILNNCFFIIGAFYQPILVLAYTIARQRDLLTRFGLLDDIPELYPEAIIDALFPDKKVIDSQLRFVLTAKIGNATISEAISVDIIDKILRISPLQTG